MASSRQASSEGEAVSEECELSLRAVETGAGTGRGGVLRFVILGSDSGGRRGSRDDARRLAEGRTRDGNDPEERDCRWDAEMGGGWAAMAPESVAVAAAAVRDSMQDWAAWAARRQHSAFPKARDALLALDAASKRRS